MGILALLLPLLKELVQGFPWAEWEGKGEKAMWAAYQNWVQDQWTTHRAAIARKMTAEGWNYSSTTPNRPDPPGAFVADIQYRLWHLVYWGGWPRDVMRDEHYPKILAAVKDKLTPETPAEEAVKIVTQAETDLFF
jgi:hypothetical protein